MSMGPELGTAGAEVGKPMLGPLGDLIFLDRYSRKDHDRTHIAQGDRVVVCLDINNRDKQRELATVGAVRGSELVVDLINKARTEIIPLDQADLPVETFEQAVARIASTGASVESSDRRAKWVGRFHDIVGSLSFVPAGRIWAGAGVEEKLTPFNCYVLPAPRDSRHGIIDTLDRMTEIMSRGGGVGIPLMSLRPKFGYVKGVNGRSSGSVAWGEIYSFGTGLIEQGGSRRGALMLIQYCWHPDVLEFIAAKREEKENALKALAAIRALGLDELAAPIQEALKQIKGRLNNCNISVGLTDDFMAAVEADGMWDLVFPDTSHSAYDTSWNGDLKAWVGAGLPVKTYSSVKARDLWNEIIDSAWTSAEPGLFFVDRYNALSNSWYYQQGRIWCTNPCGEQGIPGNAVCNLGHLNLSQYLIGDGNVEPARVDWDRLKADTRTAVRFMDNVIDIAYYPFKENETQQKGERRVGLGTMGLAEMLTRLHIRYGENDECLTLLDELYRTICREAYLASADLAAEKGSFPLFDADRFLQSGFARTLPDDVRAAIREKGLRNVTLLTQAPTGTVGTMVATSTGIEPWFAWENVREGRLGRHVERASVYGDYLAAHPDVAEQRASLSDMDRAVGCKYLPAWFTNSMDMTPADHAYTQAAIQRWVDSSISKTSNLPEDYTREQVGEFYRLLYSLNCKGGTVYRNNSRSQQVLSFGSGEDSGTAQGLFASMPGLREKLTAALGTPTAVAVAAPSSKIPELKNVPDDEYDMIARSVKTPAGKLNAKIGLHPEDGEPFEAWLDVSKAGTQLNAFREAMARMISVLLRLDSPVPPMRRLQIIADQLQGIGGGDTVGFGPDRVLSVPDGVGKALGKLLEALVARRRHAAVAVPELALAAPQRPANGNGSAKTNGNRHKTNGNGHAKVSAPAGLELVMDVAPVAQVAQLRFFDLCPHCHQNTLQRIEGCEKCVACPYSRC